MNKFSEEFMKVARQQYGLEEDDTSRDDEINAYTKLEMLDKMLKWEGILGYIDYIVSWINELFDVDLEDLNE